MRRPRDTPAQDGGTWLVRLERRLLTVFGPAQLSPLEREPPPAQERTSGVSGSWVVRRDAAGVAYLEAGEPPEGTSAAPRSTKRSS